MNALLLKAIAQVEGNRILVCPLDWGLGHATRCVPIIRALLAADKQVILAADGAAYQFLQQEFPHLPLVRFAGLTVRYSASHSQVGAMLAQLPKFLFQIMREHRNLQKIIVLHKIDTVISDNRFGLWTQRAQCIYITHQLMVKMPPRWRFLEKTVWKFHRKIIQKYDFCWIPDSETEQLAGDLAHKYKLPKNGVFIGIISRFDAQKKYSKSADFDAIGITSGPEPQRTRFEEQLVRLFAAAEGRCLVVRGLPNEPEKRSAVGNITFCNHLTTSEMQRLLQTTPRIVCRSGYSTLMDLRTLGRTATLVPTPGQTEQEYLVEYTTRFGFDTLAKNKGDFYKFPIS